MPNLTEFGLSPVLDLADIIAIREWVRQVELSDALVDYLVDLIRATRQHPSLLAGASPRSANMVATASRAYAALQGRPYVIPDDIKAIALPTLAHRLVLAPGAEIEGLTSDGILTQIIAQVPAPR